jgi:hypothetical protein
MTYRTGDIAAAAMVDASDRVLVAKSGCNERHQGELVKRIGLAVNDDARAAAFEPVRIFVGEAVSGINRVPE